MGWLRTNHRFDNLYAEKRQESGDAMASVAKIAKTATI
jgi:hypothetical protein